MKNIFFVYTRDTTCIYSVHIFLYVQTHEKNRKRIFEILVNPKNKRIIIIISDGSYSFSFFLFFTFYLFIFYFLLLFFFLTISTFEFFNAARLFGNWKLRRNNVIFVIYNALLGCCVLKLYKIVLSIFIDSFFYNRRRNLIFRLSMLHFRFEEDRDISIRIIFRFVVGTSREKYPNHEYVSVN